MSGTISYDLRGPGIEITCNADGLRVDGDDFLLKQKYFPGKEEGFTRVADDVGEMITVVLLPSSRNGTKVTLSVLLPDTDLSGDGAPSEVTGAAIIAQQFHDRVDGPPAVLQRYETRPLTGSASRIA